MNNVAASTNANTVFSAHYCKPQMLDVTFLHFIHIMATFPRESTKHQPEKGLVVVGHIGETDTKQQTRVKNHPTVDIFGLFQQNHIGTFNKHR